MSTEATIPVTDPRVLQTRKTYDLEEWRARRFAEKPEIGRMADFMAGELFRAARDAGVPDVQGVPGSRVIVTLRLESDG